MREKPSSGIVSQAQIRRLYAMATDRGWTHEGVLDLVRVNYGARSTTELTREEYEEVVKHIETSIVPNTAIMARDRNTRDMFE